MKRILYLLLIVCSAGYGQTINIGGKIYTRVDGRLAYSNIGSTQITGAYLFLPIDTAAGAPAGSVALLHDTSLYARGATKWSKVSGGGGGSGGVSAVVYKNDSTFTVTTNGTPADIVIKGGKIQLVTDSNFAVHAGVGSAPDTLVCVSCGGTVTFVKDATLRDVGGAVGVDTTAGIGHVATKYDLTQVSGGSYTLPTASTSVLGGVKVDGTTITIASGVISSSGGSGAAPAIGQVVTSATAGPFFFGGTGGRLMQKANSLYLDSTNNRIGIGNSAPDSTLKLTGSLNVTSNANFGTNITLGNKNMATVSTGTLLDIGNDAAFNGTRIYGGGAGGPKIQVDNSSLSINTGSIFNYGMPTCVGCLTVLGHAADSSLRQVPIASLGAPIYDSLGPKPLQILTAAATTKWPWNGKSAYLGVDRITTIQVDSLTAGRVYNIQLEVVQDTVGGWIPTLPGDAKSVVWLINPNQKNVLHGYYNGTSFAWESMFQGSWSWDSTVASYDADAQAYFTAAGITDATQKAAYNAFVIGLKSDGAYTPLRAFYPYLGGSLTTASYNAIDATKYQITWTGTPTLGSLGMQFNQSSQYGNTHFNPSTQVTGSLGAMLGFYGETNAAGVDWAMGTGLGYGGGNFYIAPNGGDGHAYSASGAGDYGTSSAQNKTKLHFAGREPSGGSDLVYYRDGTELYAGSVTAPIIAYPNFDVFVGGINGDATIFYSGITIGCSVISNGMSSAQATSLKTRVNALMTALSR